MFTDCLLMYRGNSFNLTSKVYFVFKMQFICLLEKVKSLLLTRLTYFNDQSAKSKIMVG